MCFDHLPLLLLLMMMSIVVWFAGVFVKESDVAAFTIRALDDPRTLNKVVYLRPQGNVYSMNELVEIWESKIGKKLDKVFVSEEELLERVKGNFSSLYYLVFKLIASGLNEAYMTFLLRLGIKKSKIEENKWLRLKCNSLPNIQKSDDLVTN